ncbi:MAG: hypothetical protein Q9209_006111 [Squamulea sp. 1 TL-2023]
MILLFTFTLTNTITLFALSVLLVRNIYILASNTTTIEGWEIERHETLVRRARRHGGYLDGPDGVKIRITKQEFPYDIGIYQNVRQGMGTTFLLWLWPFASTPSNESGLDFETNGFEEILTSIDPNTSWPPPDPDRMPRRRYNLEDHDPFTHQDHATVIDIQAFRQRQQKDHMRFANGDSFITRRGFSHISDQLPDPINDERSNDIGPGWKDSDGDRLQDFGVDEEIEYFDEDDLPLAKVLKRRQHAHI